MLDLTHFFPPFAPCNHSVFQGFPLLWLWKYFLTAKPVILYIFFLSELWKNFILFLHFLSFLWTSDGLPLDSVTVLQSASWWQFPHKFPLCACQRTCQFRVSFPSGNVRPLFLLPPDLTCAGCSFKPPTQLWFWDYPFTEWFPTSSAHWNHWVGGRL